MIIPDIDVNLATEVRDVLNDAGGKVNDNLLSFFTEDAKLKKWSKHKPVKYNSDFPLTEEEYDKLYGDKLYWWKAYDGLCGFTQDSIKFNTIDDIINAYRNNQTFVYDLPTGGQLYPCRLGDFRNYDTDAKSPIWSFEITAGQMMVDSNGYSDQNGSYYTFTILGNGDIDPKYNLTMQDIAYNDTDFTLADLFFGIIISNLQGNKYFLINGGQFVGDETDWNQDITVTLSDMEQHGMATIGQYVAYPVIVSGENKHFYPCDVPAVPFSIILDPAESKVGWLEDEPHYCKMMSNGTLRFYGKLAWSDDYENTLFTFDAYIIRKNGTKDTVKTDAVYPVKDEEKQNSDNIYYMYIGDEPYLVLEGRKSIEEGDIYVLSVSYPNSTGTVISQTMQWTDSPIISGPDDL